MPTVDLNADLGEGFEFDVELMGIVSSCNIACGGHTGNEASMATTVQLAVANNVRIGAHPSYPDRAGFGRTSGFVDGEILKQSLVEQIVNLKDIASVAGASVAHVKPHGALYNDATTDRDLANIVIAATQDAIPSAALMGPPASALQRAASARQMRFIAEAFVDRAYLPDGKLVPRSEPNAVHGDINTITTQALTLATSGTVTASNGDVIDIRAETLCIHGDTGNASQVARAVRDVLETNGVVIHAAH